MPKQNVRKPTIQWLAHVARSERAARRYENARSGRRAHRDMVQARFDLGFGIGLTHG
jgi:hypothetical protein